MLSYRSYLYLGGFDTIDDIPATMDGEVAVGLSLNQATIIAARANAGRNGGDKRRAREKPAGRGVFNGAYGTQSCNHAKDFSPQRR